MNHWYWKKRKKKSAAPFLTAASSAMTVAFTSSPFVASEPQPTKKLEDKGLAIEPILGVRTFDVSTDEGFGLHSLNGVYWPPYEPLSAYCVNNPLADHETPYLDCMCGIYAWKWEDWTKGHHAQVKLWGEVYLWGEVIICELGYRAEFAYPKSLHINAVPTRSAQRIRDGLAETYGVPVTLTDPPKPTVAEAVAAVPGYQWGPTGPAGMYGSTGATGPAIPYLYPPGYFPPQYPSGSQGGSTST